MEDALWKKVTRLVPAHNAGDSRCWYSHRNIVLTALWAILHDRPMVWACDPANWPGRYRPQRLPTQSTLSRRMSSKGINCVIRGVFQRICVEAGPVGEVGYVDGCALRVGGASKDRHARRGRAVGGFAKGYKLHALADSQGFIRDFRVMPLNRNEVPVMRRLVETTPELPLRIVGDKEYDGVKLHRQCQARGSKLYAMPRGGRVGRRNQPERRKCLEFLLTEAGQRLLRSRTAIERVFSRLKSVGFGLKELPAWTRTLRRVRAWITGKVLLYNVHVLMTRAKGHA